MRAGEAAVGVFDSGVGGLSVLRAIRTLLPEESLLYVADTAHVPYGSKSEAEIRERSRRITRFLIEQGAKTVVVACNTATAAAVGTLREEFAVPVVAMEPAVKPAAAATRSGVVGVLATAGTLGSRRFAQLTERYGATVRVITQPCPGLVEQVEKGDLSGPATRALLQRYVTPLLEAGADTLILGCTHYPFLRPLIRELVGEAVSLIDTGDAVAAQLRRVLTAHDLLRLEAAQAPRFWASGDIAQTAAVIRTLWQGPATVQVLP